MAINSVGEHDSSAYRSRKISLFCVRCIGMRSYVVYNTDLSRLHLYIPVQIFFFSTQTITFGITSFFF